MQCSVQIIAQPTLCNNCSVISMFNKAQHIDEHCIILHILILIIYTWFIVCNVQFWLLHCKPGGVLKWPQCNFNVSNNVLAMLLRKTNAYNCMQLLNSLYISFQPWLLHFKYGEILEWWQCIFNVSNNIYQAKTTYCIILNAIVDSDYQHIVNCMQCSVLNIALQT